MSSKYDPYLRPTWWTVIDAANIICGHVPPDKAWKKARPTDEKATIPPFDMEILTGGERALLYFELKNVLAEKGIEISANARIRPQLALRVAQNLGITPPAELLPLLEDEPVPEQRASSRDHVSDNLAFLNQASEKWWKNADRDDDTTQPDNDTVAAWLESKGLSQSLAKAGATIIRPPWAFKGRRKGE